MSRTASSRTRRTPRSLATLALAAGLLGATVGSQAVAQAQPPRQQPAASSPAAVPSAAPAPGEKVRGDLRASQLIGKDVRNPQGEDIGQINDLLVDTSTGRVEYAVLSYGGILNIGNKLFPYPPNVFGAPMNPDDEVLVLNVPKDRLSQAPGFDRNNWPNFDQDRSLLNQSDQYHGSPGNQARLQRQDDAGASQAAGTASGSRLVRASRLIDRDVLDKTGGEAGEIEDLVVNLQEQQVRYIVMDFEDAWNTDDRLIPLPMGGLSFSNQDDVSPVINLERDRIDPASGFDGDRWPDLNDPNHQRSVDETLRTLQAR